MDNNTLKRLNQALTLYFIRILPFILLFGAFIYFSEYLWAYIQGNYTEFYEDEILAYIKYDTCIYDIFDRLYFYMFLTTVWLLSKRMAYCFYYRLPLIYIFVVQLIIDVFGDKITAGTTLLFISTGMILFAVTIALMVRNYLRNGKRSRYLQ